MAARDRSRSPAKADGAKEGKRVLISGSHGFISGYVINILLEQGHEVYGVDNFWKYGKLSRSFDSNPKFHFFEGDAKDVDFMRKIVFDNNVQIFVASAATMLADAGLTPLEQFHAVDATVQASVAFKCSPQSEAQIQSGNAGDASKVTGLLIFENKALEFAFTPDSANILSTAGISGAMTGTDVEDVTSVIQETGIFTAADEEFVHQHQHTCRNDALRISCAPQHAQGVSLAVVAHRFQLP